MALYQYSSSTRAGLSPIAKFDHRKRERNSTNLKKLNSWQLASILCKLSNCDYVVLKVNYLLIFFSNSWDFSILQKSKLNFENSKKKTKLGLFWIARYSVKTITNVEQGGTACGVARSKLANGLFSLFNI